MKSSELNKKVQILLQLQDNEIEAASVSSRVEDLPARVELLAARLEQHKNRIGETEARVAELQKTYRQQEAEAQTIQAQIEKSNEKLKTVKTNKEYQAGLQEIEDLNQLQSGIEDKMLENLEAIDEAESAVASERDNFAAFSRQTEQEKAQVETESVEMQQKLKQLQQERAQLVAAIDPDLIEKYEQTKQYTGAVAVAAVKDAVCQGCHMNIPPQMYNELQRFDRLLVCPHCERIIYPQGVQNEE